LTFIRADLSAFQPRPDSNGVDYGEAGSSAFGMETSSEPRFPKSLFLVQPLFTTFELNPVAAQAQASVPVPEGLDLHAWIVPPLADAVAMETSDVEDVLAASKKKTKKGKGKETTGAKTKRKKRREGEGAGGDVLTPSVVETEEEKAERERVSPTSDWDTQ
jgi:AP-3 complex subunit delta